MPADQPLVDFSPAGQLSPFLQEFAASRLKSALQITSVCGHRCIFCSNRFNPFAMRRQEHRGLDDIRLQLEAVLPRNGFVELGLTTPGRLAEGDPLTHPQFFEILDMIRNFFQRYDALVGVMFPTLGAQLTEAVTARLVSTGLPIKIDTLSINSSNRENWLKIIRGSPEAARVAIEAPPRLGEAGIPYSASLVALPALVGWRDIEDTIDYVVQSGTAEVVIWEPGVSKMVDDDTVRLMQCDSEQLRHRVRDWQQTHGWEVPVRVYPLGVNQRERELMRAVIRHQTHGPTLLLCSEAAHRAVQEELTGLHMPWVTARPVRNLTYGGNMCVSGLLCVADYAAAAADYLSQPGSPPVQRIVIPANSFDVFGRDLMYRHYSEIAATLKRDRRPDVEVCLDQDFL